MALYRPIVRSSRGTQVRQKLKTDVKKPDKPVRVSHKESFKLYFTFNMAGTSEAAAIYGATHGRMSPLAELQRLIPNQLESSRNWIQVAEPSSLQAPGAPSAARSTLYEIRLLIPRTQASAGLKAGWSADARCGTNDSVRGTGQLSGKPWGGHVACIVNNPSSDRTRDPRTRSLRQYSHVTRCT